MNPVHFSVHSCPCCKLLKLSTFLVSVHSGSLLHEPPNAMIFGLFSGFRGSGSLLPPPHPTLGRNDMTAQPIAFTFRGHRLDAEARADGHWFSLFQLCALLGTVTLEDATNFLTPDVDRLEQGERGTWVNEEGLWAVVSLSGQRLQMDEASWLHTLVMPAMRRKAFERSPGPDRPEVRELWYIIDQLRDAKDLVNFSSDSGVLAIRSADVWLAAMRHGYAVPSHAHFRKLLSASEHPKYLGIQAFDRTWGKIRCMAFAA